MPIYLDPNPLNTCCSSAGPPLSLQIILNSAAVFKFGQKLHPNLCMEGECTTRSLSNPYIFLHLVILWSFLWNPMGLTTAVLGLILPHLWGNTQQNLSCPPSVTAIQKREGTTPIFQGLVLPPLYFFSIQQIMDIREGIQIRNCIFPSYIFLPTHFQVITDRNIFRHYTQILPSSGTWIQPLKQMLF